MRLQLPDIAILVSYLVRVVLVGWYYRKEEHHLVKEKHWWPQAEAMVFF